MTPLFLPHPYTLAHVFRRDGLVDRALRSQQQRSKDFQQDLQEVRAGQGLSGRQEYGIKTKNKEEGEEEGTDRQTERREAQRNSRNDKAQEKEKAKQTRNSLIGSSWSADTYFFLRVWHLALLRCVTTIVRGARMYASKRLSKGREDRGELLILGPRNCILSPAWADARFPTIRTCFTTGTSHASLMSHGRPYDHLHVITDVLVIPINSVIADDTSKTRRCQRRCSEGSLT